MIRTFLLAATILAATPALAEPDYAAAIRADYDKDLGKLWDNFHRPPELSFREYKTAAIMAAELRKVPGMEVTEKVGQTGVVGVLKNGDGPVVLVRADMDGLPVEEKSAGWVGTNSRYWFPIWTTAVSWANLRRRLFKHFRSPTQSTRVGPS